VNDFNVPHQPSSRCHLDCWVGWVQVIMYYMGFQIPTAREQFWGGKRRPIVKIGMLCCAQMAAAIDLLFGRHVDSGGPKEALLDGRAHWRNLANTTEPSVCNGNAALCQITMTTCYRQNCAQLKPPVFNLLRGRFLACRLAGWNVAPMGWTSKPNFTPIGATTRV